VIYHYEVGRFWPGTRSPLEESLAKSERPWEVLEEMGYDANLSRDADLSRPSVWLCGHRERDGRIALLVRVVSQTFVVFVAGLPHLLGAMRELRALLEE